MHAGQAFAECVWGGGQGRFLVRSLVDGAGSYSVAHRAGLLPTELTGMWGWILLRSPHQGRGSPPAPAPTRQRPDAGTVLDSVRTADPMSIVLTKFAVKRTGSATSGRTTHPRAHGTCTAGHGGRHQGAAQGYKRQGAHVCHGDEVGRVCSFKRPGKSIGGPSGRPRL